MIYKTCFGKHIDLSKIISISDAYRAYDAFPMMKFEIYCQLLDEPIIFRNHNHFNTIEEGLADFQQKIDELIKVWKAFKKSQQTCETCGNYKQKYIELTSCPDCQSSNIWIRDKKPESWRCGDCDGVWTIKEINY